MTDTSNMNGRRLTRKVDAVEAAGERAATLAKWMTRALLGLSALTTATMAFVHGSVTLGILAGGQMVAAVLLSRE